MASSPKAPETPTDGSWEKTERKFSQYVFLLVGSFSALRHILYQYFPCNPDYIARLIPLVWLEDRFCWGFNVISWLLARRDAPVHMSGSWKTRSTFALMQLHVADNSSWCEQCHFYTYSKSASEYFDPCQEFADRSLKCMRRNGFDREMCGDYFQ